VTEEIRAGFPMGESPVTHSGRGFVISEFAVRFFYSYTSFFAGNLDNLLNIFTPQVSFRRGLWIFPLSVNAYVVRCIAVDASERGYPFMNNS